MPIKTQNRQRFKMRDRLLNYDSTVVYNCSNTRTLDWSDNKVLKGNITLGQGTSDEVTLITA